MTTFYQLTELQRTRLENLLERWSSSVTSANGIEKVIKSSALGPLVLINGMSQVPSGGNPAVVPGLVTMPEIFEVPSPVSSPLPFSNQQLVTQNLELSITDDSGDTQSSQFVASTSGPASQNQHMSQLERKMTEQVAEQ